MTEKCYGGNRLSYVVTARSGTGRIQLFVFHENKEMQQILRKKSDNPGELLKRYGAYTDSHTRAKYWLAKVMEDHWTHF